MNTVKRSVIWTINDEDFRKVCVSSKSLADILRYFNLCVGAGNYKTVKRRIEESGIDISHITLGNNSNKNRRFGSRKPIESYLVYGNISRKQLKKMLLDSGLMKNECSICGIGDMYNEKPIVNRLDHIDGDTDNNVFSNLRMVCPNCDSQLDTYCSRNIRR